MRLDGRTVAITGAAQGLGFAIASAAVAAGAEVAMLDSDGTALTGAAKRLSQAAIECDVRDPDSARTAADALAAWRPRLDVLVNNAGVWTDNEIERDDPRRRNLAFDTNAVGTINVTEAVLPLMQRHGSGHIFNVISTAGDALSPSGDNRQWAAYGASKWAMTGYTKTLRENLAGSGIRVTGFFPGGIDTNLYENAGWPTDAHGQPWMMRAEDVAEVVVFALTRPADVHVESLTLTKHLGS